MSEKEGRTNIDADEILDDFWWSFNEIV